MGNYIICDYCHREFERDNRHIHEAEKFNWKQFCSIKCQKNYRRTGKVLICGNKKCKRKFYRQIGEMKKNKNYFCSNHCAAVFNNEIRSVNKRTKKCANPDCKNLILSARIYCSQICFLKCVNLVPSVNRIDKIIYKERVIKAIKIFVKNNNRVPFKVEMRNLYRPARIAFGTWNNAVKAAGFKPNKLKFTHKYIANDKHVCDSLAEKIIDDWLFARKISHQRGVYYPNQKKFKTDFKVGNYWIEFFGLTGQLKTYDVLKKKKLELIKILRLKLIKIYPRDLFPVNLLDKRLGFLLD